MENTPGRVDVHHHHVVPKEYVRAVSKLGVTKGLGVGLPNWDVNKALDVMTRHGISTVVLFA
jgi:6-methylsalicylate decarboxylase